MPHLFRKISFYIRRNASTLNPSTPLFGTFSVVDVPMHQNSGNASKSIGRLRGFTLVDAIDCKSLLYHFITDFNSNFARGGLLLQGRSFSGKTTPTEILVTGTSGIFRFASGYSTLYPEVDEDIDYVEVFLYKY